MASIESGADRLRPIPLDVPGSRSFQIETTFVITPDGARPINPQDRARIALASTARLRTIQP